MAKQNSLVPNVTAFEKMLRDAIKASPESVATIAENAKVNRTTLSKFLTTPGRALQWQTLTPLALYLGFGLVRQQGILTDEGFEIQEEARVLFQYIDREVMPLAGLAGSPIPIYCSDLTTGNFQFVNNSFARLFGFETGAAFVEAFPNANSLYPSPTPRKEWVSELRENPKVGFGRVHISNLYVKRRSSGEDERRRVSVAEFARLIEFGGRDYAVGVGLNITDQQLEYERKASLVDAFVMLINDAGCNLGVHIVEKKDGSPELNDVNKYERDLLGLGEAWWEQLQSIKELSDDPKAIERTLDKLNGDSDLTKDGFRMFVDHRDKKLEASLSVIINDYPVKDPAYSFDPAEFQTRRLSGIVTSVRDARIPGDIVHILRNYGPRNPILESAGVYSIIKRCTNPESPELSFEFDFANRALKQRLVGLRKLKECIRCDKIDNVTYDSDGFESVKGKTEKELFDKFEHKYRQSDQIVYSIAKENPDESRPLQQIEDHPLRPSGVVLAGATVKVHVIKMPYKDAFGEVVGVEVFFWEVNNEAQVFQILRKAYEPWAYLDDIPVPVYRKGVYRQGSDLLFTYANKAYVKNIKRVLQEASLSNEGETGIIVESLRDIIGLGDKQLFGETQASKYESDDQELLAGPKDVLERIERNGNRWVKVIKKAILRSSDKHKPQSDSMIGAKRRDVEAIQGVFWTLGVEEMNEFLSQAAAWDTNNQRPKT